MSYYLRDIGAPLAGDSIGDYSANTFTASAFYGNGTFLTHLNANLISQGVLPFARLPGNLLTTNHKDVANGLAVLGPDRRLAIDRLPAGLDTSLNASNIASGVLSVLYGGTGTTQATGNGAVVLNDSPIFDTLVTIEGNLVVKGNITYVDEQRADQLVIVNDGTGPALVVRQNLTQPLLQIMDDANIVLKIYDGGFTALGPGSSNALNTAGAPPALLSVSGNIATANGTSTQPAYAFQADAGTGLFLAQHNILGVAGNVHIPALQSHRVIVTGPGNLLTHSALTSTQLETLTGIRDNVQTQLDSLQPLVTGAATSILSANVEPFKVLVSNGAGKVVASNVHVTELESLRGITGNVGSLQTQVDSLGNVGNVTTANVNLLQETTANLQTQLDGLELGALVANLEPNRAIVSDPTGNLATSTVSTTELQYLKGVTGNIQSQLNGLMAGVITDSLTPLKSLITDASGNISTSNVSVSELQALTGISGNIQLQLLDKEPLISVLPISKGGTGTTQASGSAGNLVLSNSPTLEGNISLTGLLNFGSRVQNNLVSLWGGIQDPNATSFFGFGVNSGVLRYQANTATNQHAFYGGATLFGNISSAGFHSANLGLVSAPSYSFTGDSNTGLYSPGADSLALVAGGAERLRVNSNGVQIPSLTSSRVVITDISSNVLSTSSVTSTELSYLSGVSSNLQTQLAAKQGSITGAATSVLTSNLSALRVVVSDASGKLDVAAVTSTELSYVSGVTSSLQTQLAAKQASITGAATSITTSNLTGSRALVSDGLGKVGVSTVTSTELSYLSGVTSAIQSQLAGKQATLTGAATSIATADLSISRALISDTLGKIGVSAATATEIGYLSGVSSSLQSQLDTKQSVITGAATTITSTNVLASRALVSDVSGKVSTSLVTSTELEYLSGATSNIQQQLNTLMSASTVADLTPSRALVTTDTGDIGVSAVTATQLSYLSGATSSLQTQLNAKQATLTGAATTVTSSNLTINRGLVSDASGKIGVSTVTATEVGYLSGTTSAIQTQLNGKEPTISVLAVARGGSGVSSSTGSGNLVLSSAPVFQSNVSIQGNLSVSVLTGGRALVTNTVSGLAVSSVTATELGYVSGLSSAVQTQLNSKQATLTGAATTVTSSNLTASRGLVSDASGKIGVSTVTATELGYLSGTTSAIQTQLNAKQATITGAASSIVSSDLTGSRALTSDALGKIGVSTVTATEVGYLSGTTSAIQSQLNAKEPTISVLPVSKGGTGQTNSTGSSSVVLSNAPTLTGNVAVTGNVSVSQTLTATTYSGLPAASTSTAGIVQLTTGTNDSGTTNAPQSAALKALADRSVTAGNGLTGGGTLQASVTLSMGTPSSITATSTNTVTATSHTHAITSLPSQFDIRTLYPSNIAGSTVSFGFGSFNNNSSLPYADIIHWNTWSDSSGGLQNALMISKSTRNIRLFQGTFGSTTSYSSYSDCVMADSSGSVSVSGTLTATTYSGLPAASTSAAGIVQLTTGTNDSGTTNAPQSAALKALADRSVTAGNGLTGGGTLQATRTLTLGTPSDISATSTNAVTATSHTHAITSLPSGLTFPAALGAVTSPGFCFSGDTNTGMWSPTADTLAFSTNGAERVRVDSSGRVGIGTTGPTEALVVSGNIAVTGGVATSASDKRLKTNIGPIVDGSPLDALCQLRGVRFTWREDGPQPMRGTDVGLLAQDVAAILPEAVAPAPFDSSYMTIKSHHQISALVIEALREEVAHRQALERRLTALEAAL